MVPEGGMAQLDWWPVDKLILGYYAVAVAIEAFLWSRLPEAPLLIALHLAAAALLILAVRFPDAQGSLAFRHWYPLPCVAACYREMSLLIPVLRDTDYDQWAARLDAAIWGAQPTLWLERWRNPLAEEVLQIVYSLFVPVVLLVAWELWRRKMRIEFRYYAFLIALGFLTSYLGYLAVPVRGPRFFLHGQYSFELGGRWLFGWLRGTLDLIESAHYDCFPSGHTELMLLAWWGSRRISANWSRFYFVYTLGVMFATVYLRYHYTIDVAAGVVLAGLLIAMSPWLYPRLGHKLPSE
jgi:membrane-associated phospholipid phosphatase